MRTRRDEWVVDSDGLTDEERVRTTREVLALFASDVAEAAFDVVTPDGPTPPGFADAADLLRHRARGRVEDAGYWTFDRAPVDDEIWAAVLTVAPFSYFADLYGPQGGAPIVSLADEATSSVVRAAGERLAQVERVVGRDRLVPLTAWRAHRRAARREARRRRSPHGSPRLGPDHGRGAVTRGGASRRRAGLVPLTTGRGRWWHLDGARGKLTTPKSSLSRRVTVSGADSGLRVSSR